MGGLSALIVERSVRPAPAGPWSLYPQGFGAGRLMEVVDTQAVWEGV